MRCGKVWALDYVSKAFFGAALVLLFGAMGTVLIPAARAEAILPQPLVVPSDPLCDPGCGGGSCQVVYGHCINADDPNGGTGCNDGIGEPTCPACFCGNSSCECVTSNDGG